MTRLLVHVEGQTEESFVNEILAPHLYGVGYHSVGARIMGKARLRTRRGGIKSWDVVKSEIERHLSHDHGCLATLMVDYYALPNNWPGKVESATLPADQRAPFVQNQILTDFEESTGFGARFEPNILMHEFEALLFSDCERFAAGIYQPALANKFQQIRDQFASPEQINDSPHTAPSKRVLALVQGYDKVIYGTLAASEVGLAAMRAECANFHDWMCRLEARVMYLGLVSI